MNIEQTLCTEQDKLFLKFEIFQIDLQTESFTDGGEHKEIFFINIL